MYHEKDSALATVQVPTSRDSYSDEESALGQHVGLISEMPKTQPSAASSSGRRGLKATLAVGLFASYVATFFAGRLSWTAANLASTCLRETSAYSPLLREMDPAPKMTQFNGSLGFETAYTGDPSPELDATWYRWSHIRYASIPEDEFMQLPGAEEHFQDHARLTPEMGGGYLGFVEFNHQMHCLNLLRQGLHPEYYNNPDKPENRPLAFTDHPGTLKKHIEHCIETLRQNIMCNADVGIVPSVWLTGNHYPYANFNTFHQCRDLDTVERWIEDHEIDHTVGADFPIPAGSKTYDVPP